MTDLPPPPAPSGVTSPPPLAAQPPPPPPVLPPPPSTAPAPHAPPATTAFAAADNALLFEINGTLKSIHRILQLFAAALAIWIVIGLLVVVGSAWRSSSRADSDAYIECVMAGRSNCR